MIKRLSVAVFVIAAVIVMATSPRAIEGRKQFDDQSRVLRFQSCSRPCGSPLGRAIGGVTYPSEIGQDKWVIGKMFPGRHAMVSFWTSAPVTAPSAQTPRRSKNSGWTGICVDPFPTHMEGRTCRMEKVVVSSAAGQVVKFHTHAGLGGIADTLGKWKDEAAKESGGRVDHDHAWRRARPRPARRRTSTSSAWISRAPSSRRSAACRSTRYRFGAMAIEHNDEEPKRTDLLKFSGSERLPAGAHLQTGRLLRAALVAWRRRLSGARALNTSQSSQFLRSNS